MCSYILSCLQNIWTSTQQRRDVTVTSEAESQETQAHTVQGGTGVEGEGEREEERSREGGEQEKEEVRSKQPEGREEGAAGEDASITADVVRKFQQQLEEIKVAPR